MASTLQTGGDRQERSKLINTFAKALSPVVLKFLTESIKNDLSLPPEAQIYSGPNKNLESVFLEFTEIIQSKAFRDALIWTIRKQTYGLAFVEDLDTPLEDVVHNQQTLTIIHDILDKLLVNTSVQRVLQNPSLDAKTKVVNLEPVLNKFIDRQIVKLRNFCFTPEWDPNYIDKLYNSNYYDKTFGQVCKDPENLARERASTQKMETILQTKVTEMAHKTGSKLGLNLSGFRAKNLLGMAFKSRKARRSNRKTRRNRRA